MKHIIKFGILIFFSKEYPYFYWKKERLKFWSSFTLLKRWILNKFVVRIKYLRLLTMPIAHFDTSVGMNLNVLIKTFDEFGFFLIET